MKTLAAILATLAFAGCGASTQTTYNHSTPPTQPTVTQAVVEPAQTVTQPTRTVTAPAPEHYAKPHKHVHTHEIGAVVENPNEPAEHDELEEGETK